jgi:hypothetical protein
MHSLASCIAASMRGVLQNYKYMINCKVLTYSILMIGIKTAVKEHLKGLMLVFVADHV